SFQAPAAGSPQCRTDRNRHALKFAASSLRRTVPRRLTTPDGEVRVISRSPRRGCAAVNSTSTCSIEKPEYCAPIVMMFETPDGLSSGIARPTTLATAGTAASVATLVQVAAWVTA